MKSLAFLPLALFAAAARADVVSRFDVDNEGWTTAAVSPLNLSTLGTGVTTWSAGVIKATEFSVIPGDLFALVAPAKFIGNKSAYYGGQVTYRLNDETSNVGSAPNLLLRGNGIALAYVTAPPPVAGGPDFSFSLTETGWITFAGVAATKAQFQSALANLDTFGINADWTGGGQDKVTLDNVVMAAPVPEPATLAALGLGIAGLARRRATKRG